MHPPFTPIIAEICRRFHSHPYWVGGTVRDYVLKQPCHDWDLVCVQAKKVAQATARKLSARFITLDEQNRIYRLVLPEESGRRLTLDFAELQGKNIEQDLARRDFSINAMAVVLGSEKIIDPFKGQQDLKKKVLRALSRKAFVDDPLRLLRAYRLSAQFGLTPQSQTVQWIKAEQMRIHQVAAERIREEFLRLLSQKRCAVVLTTMDQQGFLTLLLPELEAGRHVGIAYYGRGGVVKHHLQSVNNLEWLLDHLDQVAFIETAAIREKIQTYVAGAVSGMPRSAFLKLGALVHDIGKPATAEVIRGRLRFFGHEDVGAQAVGKALSNLRFSRQEIQLIRLWVRNHMRPGSLASAPEMTEKAMARFFRDMGEEGVGMLLVSLGDHYTYLARSKWGKGTDPVERASQKLLSAYYLTRDRVLPPKVLDGTILMKAFRLKPGPLIGKLLEAVKDGQAGGHLKTLQDALKYAKSKLQSLQR